MSLSPAGSIRYDELLTPAEHLGVLVAPSPAGLHAAVRQAGDRDFQRARILDTNVAVLRAALRARLELSRPLVLTGHQAEFFHAGVFAKNIAVHVLARRLEGQGAFLTVDSDVPKATHLVLPQVTGHGLRRVEVRIPGREPHLAFEHQARVARADWLQFFATLAAMHHIRERSILDTFARGWLTTDDPNPRYCDALARARRASEIELGLSGLHELRMSRLCSTQAFRAFAAHMFCAARSCAQAYNAARQRFRQRHAVRAAGRPVPALVIADDSVELPLWASRAGEPRRRLFASARGAELELTTDNQVIGRLPRSAMEQSARLDEPWPFERQGWQLRPRALALSGFARLFLADVFIHGIGGAKYDEMTEEFVSEVFGVEPVPMACVSATLRLPLPCKGVSREDIINARRQSRDLRYNPQRHLKRAPADLLQRRAELVHHSDELRARAPHEHDSRRVVFREIRRTNERILETDPWRAAEYDERVRDLEAQWEVDQIALDREYFYALHPRQTLLELVERIRTALQA